MAKGKNNKMVSSMVNGLVESHEMVLEDIHETCNITHKETGKALTLDEMNKLFLWPLRNYKKTRGSAAPNKYHVFLRDQKIKDQVEKIFPILQKAIKDGSYKGKSRVIKDILVELENEDHEDDEDDEKKKTDFGNKSKILGKIWTDIKLNNPTEMKKYEDKCEEEKKIWQLKQDKIKFKINNLVDSKSNKKTNVQQTEEEEVDSDSSESDDE